MTCKIMGEQFPEYQQWMADEKRKREEHWRKVEQLKDDPQAMMLWAFDKLKELAEDCQSEGEEPTRKSPPTFQVPTAKRPRGDAAGLLSALDRHSGRIGRNDPCPCGSGKKSEKCCL